MTVRPEAVLTGFAATAGRYRLHARLLWRACPGWTSAAVLITVLSSAVDTVLLISTGQFRRTTQKDDSVQ